MKPHNSLMPGDIAVHKHASWYATIDTKRTTAADLFRSQYWVACLALKSNDLIRCVANDGSYDFFLKVETHKVASNQNAITVSMWPKLTPDVIAAAQGTAATEMVPATAHGKPVPRFEQVSGRTQWRLVGFDGQPVGDLLQNEALAAAAYDEYLAAHGITDEVDQPAVDIRTGDVAVEKPVDTARPHQFARSILKRNEKRDAKLAKRREIDEANKARTAARLAAETVA